MTEGVGFTSFLVSACRVKAAQQRLTIENDGDEETKENSKSAQLLQEHEAHLILQWEYPIILHPSCLTLLSNILKSLSEDGVPSIEQLHSEGMDAWDVLLSQGSIKRIAMRSKFIDNYILSTLANSSITQVVVLGAGMDTRPFRLPFKPYPRYFELDLSPVMNFKQSLFSIPSDPSSLLSLIGTDLMDPVWKSHLKEKGFDSSIPTLWVLEGLVLYLPESAVLSLLDDVMDLSSVGSHIMLHTVNCKEVEDSSGSSTGSDILSSLSAKMVFGVDDPTTLLTKGGKKKWNNIVSHDYQQIASILKCEQYLTDLTTNSKFTTAVLVDYNDK